MMVIVVADREKMRNRTPAHVMNVLVRWLSRKARRAGWGEGPFMIRIESDDSHSDYFIRNKVALRVTLERPL